MKDRQAFIDALDLQQDKEGHWFVAGIVYGDVGIVYGDVGIVNGCVYTVKGDVKGSVKGSVWGNINGREWKFVEEENNDEG